MRLLRVRFTVGRMMVVVLVVATLLGVYLHRLKESLTPETRLVGTDGSHRSRKMTDKEAAELEKTLATDVRRERGRMNRISWNV
jgi:hypothetical protein